MSEHHDDLVNSLTVRVPGMTCGHCQAAVTGELTKVAGVTEVSVDLYTKLVSVGGHGFSRDAVVAAIDEAGFDVAS